VPLGPESAPGVPTLFLSGPALGRVVHPGQINGGQPLRHVAIASERMDRLASTAVHLLRRHSPKMDYPGLVMPLGGDMISGKSTTNCRPSNELNTMPTVLDLFGKLGWATSVHGRAPSPRCPAVRDRQPTAREPRKYGRRTGTTPPSTLAALLLPRPSTSRRTSA